MNGNELLTCLDRTKSVRKDDARIVFRGKLDSAYAAALLAAAEAAEKIGERLAEEIMSLGNACMDILLACMEERDLPETELIGMRYDEVRYASHHPELFGLGHIKPEYTDGTVMAHLNLVRVSVRELECMAASLYGECFPGVITALNRMSSAAYVLMLRVKSGFYEREAGDRGSDLL